MMVSVVPLVGVAAVLLVIHQKVHSKKVQIKLPSSLLLKKLCKELVLLKRLLTNEWYEIARYKEE
jgi:hypothetical protein